MSVKTIAVSLFMVYILWFAPIPFHQNTNSAEADKPDPVLGPVANSIVRPDWAAGLLHQAPGEGFYGQNLGIIFYA